MAANSPGAVFFLSLSWLVTQALYSCLFLFCPVHNVNQLQFDVLLDFSELISFLCSSSIHVFLYEQVGIMGVKVKLNDALVNVYSLNKMKSLTAGVKGFDKKT